MYMISVISAEEHHPMLREKLQRHFNELKSTGWAGAPLFRTFGDVLLAYDGSSPFSDFTCAADEFSLTGGYQATLPSGERYGSFASFVLQRDGQAFELHTERDSVYPWPLYYGLSNGIAAVGNDVHAVAIALGLYELEDRAVIEMVTRNWVVGRYTTVAGVSRLWLGERLRIPASHAQLPAKLEPEKEPSQEVPNYDASSNESPCDVDHLIAQTFGHLVEAMPALHLEEEHTFVQLSGGLDSRLSCIALARSGVGRARVMTLNLEDGGELSIASTIAERLGFSHESLALDDGDEKDAHDAWLLTGGQVPLHAAASNLPVYRASLREHPQVRIVGAWPADLLVGDFVPGFGDFARRDRLHAALKYWAVDLTDPAPAYLLLGRSAFVRKHLKKLRKELSREMRTYRAPTAAQRVSHWAFEHCAPSFTLISPARLTANVLEVAPVMSPAVVRDFYSLQGEDLPQRSFYQRMIWQSAPELRDIAYHNTGKLLSPDYPQLPAMSWKLRALLSLPTPVYAKLRSWLTALSRRSSKVTESSVSTQHWNRIFEPHIREELYLGEELHARPASITDPNVRAQLSATVLGCAWTRRYLRNFVHCFEPEQPQAAFATSL